MMIVAMNPTDLEDIAEDETAARIHVLIQEGSMILIKTYVLILYRHSKLRT